MHLRYLLPNATFVFTDGCDVVPINGQRFFLTRRDAVNAAAEKGLRVTTSDVVEVIPDEPSTVGIPGVDINGDPLRPASGFGCGADGCSDCYPYTYCCWCGFEYPAPVPNRQDFPHDHLNEEG